MRNKIIALGIVLLLLASGIGTVSAFSNSGDGDWKYYKEITVKENSGKTLTDFQVLVELNAANFPANAKSDGSDLRFEDASGKELSYWIEEWNYPNNAKIWVKVPSISASGETKIKMYYGNPSASAVSDGDKVFEFFDDFEDGDFTNNPTWSKVDGADASITTIYGNYGIKMFRVGLLNPFYAASGTFDLSQSLVITYKLRLSSSDQTGGGLALETNDGYVLYNIGLSTGHWNAAETGPNSWSSGFGYDTAKTKTKASYRVEDFEYYFYFASDNIGLSRDITHDIKLIYTSSNHNWQLFVDDEDKGSVKGSTNYDSDISKIQIMGQSATCPGNGAYFDDIIVRKYTSPEPTFFLSPEIPTTKPTPTITPTPTPTTKPTPITTPTLAPTPDSEIEPLYHSIIDNKLKVEIYGSSEPNINTKNQYEILITPLDPSKASISRGTAYFAYPDDNTNIYPIELSFKSCVDHNWYLIDIAKDLAKKVWADWGVNTFMSIGIPIPGFWDAAKILMAPNSPAPPEDTAYFDNNAYDSIAVPFHPIDKRVGLLSLGPDEGVKIVIPLEFEHACTTDLHFFIEAQIWGEGAIYHHTKDIVIPINPRGETGESITGEFISGFIDWIKNIGKGVS